MADDLIPVEVVIYRQCFSTRCPVGRFPLLHDNPLGLCPACGQGTAEIGMTVKVDASLKYSDATE